MPCWPARPRCGTGPAGHSCPTRGPALHTVILLLATSGLRISEALHLTLADVDLAAGVLSIRQSKFRKSRLVPVSAATLETLRTYHDLRITVAPADPAGAFFVSGRGTGYSTSTVQAMFRDLTVQAGLREPGGRGPRLHDLRATFAVTRLLLWYRDGEDVMARLPLLSTYLGHACVSDTEVYLRITTTLLQEANTRFHAFADACSPRLVTSHERADPVPGLLRGFFEDYLAAQRDVSQNTIYAYRDVCKLFLRFAARHRGRQLIRLQLTDLGAGTVLAFLTYLESDRHNSAATRNCLLVVIDRFFAYVADQDPRHAELCRRVPGIPLKKTTSNSMTYLDQNEVKTLLAVPSARHRLGLRDRALLTLAATPAHGPPK